MRRLKTAVAAFIVGCATAFAAQAQSSPAANPFLDIQWESPLVRHLLATKVAVCQAEADRNAAPTPPPQADYWPGRQSQASLLRAVLYMAYDHYGLGLNHHFMMRHDVTMDLQRINRSGAAIRQSNGAGRRVLTPPIMTALRRADVPNNKPTVTTGEASGTMLRVRHRITDPFDLSRVGETLDRYELRSTDGPDTRFNTPLPPGAWPPFYQVGTYPTGAGEPRRAVLIRAERYTFPGVADVDGKARYDFESFAHERYRPNPVRLAPGGSSGHELLPPGMAIESALLCAHWRMEQDRFAAGQATQADREIAALLKRAGVEDEIAPGRWVIPAEGY